MRRAQITGWGGCAPPTVLANSDLEQIMETTDEWISSRSGIKERRISHTDNTELGRVAAERALAAAGLQPGDIQLIIYATLTPDMLVPSASGVLQSKLGADGCAAFDLNAACSGFVYGVTTASALITTGAYDRVLVVGAERLSRWMDYSDRATSVLFGDGAGAVVMEAQDGDAGVLATTLGNNGSWGDSLTVPGSGSSVSFVDAERDHSQNALIMDGQEIFKKAVSHMAAAANEVLEKAGMTVADVDLVIPHQANQRIMEAVARRLRLSETQLFSNIESYGNTSAASIPLALSDAISAGRVRPGAIVLLVAFGGGLSWGAVLMKWGDRVHPIETSAAELDASDHDVFGLLADNFAYFGGGARHG